MIDASLSVLDDNALTYEPADPAAPDWWDELIDISVRWLVGAYRSDNKVFGRRGVQGVLGGSAPHRRGGVSPPPITAAATSCGSASRPTARASA